MKIAKMAMAMAAAGLISGGTLSAQQAQTRDASYPQLDFPSATAKQVAYEYSNSKYYAPTEPASPSDVAPASAAATIGGCTPAQPCCQPSCNTCCKPFKPLVDRSCDFPCEEPPPCTSCCSETFDPIHLFGHSQYLRRRRIEVGGWLAQSYTANFSRPTDGFNGPVTWTDRANSYELNEVYTYIKRETNTEESWFDLGGRIDVLYGTNARWDVETGLEDRLNKYNPFLNTAIPNAYIETAVNDLKVKWGHFVSPVGFYTVGTYQNFFNTIPYTYQYGEPFTHTGFLAQYQATDDLNLGAGMTRGWDNFGNFNPGVGYLGTLTRNNLLKEGDSYALVTVYSREPDATATIPTAANGFAPAVPPNFAPRYFQTQVYSRPITSRLTYILQSDFGHQTAAFGPGTRAANWYGVNQYWYYKVNNCWSWGFNFEWFRDDGGFRVGAVLPNYTNATIGGPTQTRGYGTLTGQGGYDGNFFQMTMGPRWSPIPNLVIRPNLRFDWYSGNVNNPAGLLPFGNGNSNNQGILGTDVVLVY